VAEHAARIVVDGPKQCISGLQGARKYWCFYGIFIWTSVPRPNLLLRSQMTGFPPGPANIAHNVPPHQRLLSRCGTAVGWRCCDKRPLPRVWLTMAWAHDSKTDLSVTL
jgi:hypothetical protein